MDSGDQLEMMRLAGLPLFDLASPKDSSKVSYLTAQRVFPSLHFRV